MPSIDVICDGTGVVTFSFGGLDIISFSSRKSFHLRASDPDVQVLVGTREKYRHAQQRL
jgi:hypothetical protein